MRKKIKNINKKNFTLQAVIFQKQSVKTYEKFFGIDHPLTAHALSSLGLFYFQLKNFDKAFKNTIRSLFLTNLIGGEAVEKF